MPKDLYIALINTLEIASEPLAQGVACAKSQRISAILEFISGNCASLTSLLLKDF